jgi:hypothetical protein
VARSFARASLEGYSVIGWPFFADRCTLFQARTVSECVMLIGR